MRRFRTLVVAAVLLFSAIAVWGQSSAQLNGTITDNSGAAVPDAEITVVSSETAAERKVKTDGAGQYTIPFLSPGEYIVNVRHEGFRSWKREGVRLEVNQVARIDVSLELGAVTETVSVTSTAPLIESDSSAVGQVVETKAIEDLPLNGRNFVQLAILGPGVNGVGFGARGTIMSGSRPDDLRPGSEIFANGNREGSNNFLFDGIDNNERLTLSIVLRPSVESVREFKIQTNMFTADQGRNSGATINVITKSGSNEWHGSAYEFLRNQAFDAKNFFTRPGTNTPTLRQNQFGASFGGHAIRNKVFFFGNYEGYRRRQERVFVNTVPTLAMRNGDFSAVRDIFDPATLRADPVARSGFVRDPFPGRIVPRNRWDAVTSKLIDAYPLPQTSGLANNHTSTPKEAQEWNQGDGRFDWNLNERNIISGRYSRQDTATTRPSTFAPVTIPGLDTPVSLGNEDTFAGTSQLYAHHSVLTWVRTLSPSLILEAKAGFSRFNLRFLQEGASQGARLGEKLGVVNSNQGPNSDGIPIFSPAGYTGIGQTRSLPIIRIETTIQPVVNLTKLLGAHTVKFGADFRHRDLTQYQTNRGNGRFNFARTFTDDPNNTGATGDAMAAFLLGTASTIEQDFTLVQPLIRIWESNGYLQDDWRATQKLTFNIGLRYEYDTPPTEKYNRWTNFDVTTGKLLIAGFNTDDATGIQGYKKNFAPRFGFALQPRQGTVVRGGYGIFYNPAGSESQLLRRHRQLPFGPINAEDVNQFVANPRRVQAGFRPIPNLDPSVVANNPVGNMIAVEPGFRAGYAQQFNLQIQQQLPSSMVFKVGYVGNLGRRLDNSYNYNQQLPGPGAPGPRRPLFAIAPNVLTVDYNVSDGRSSYHSLQSTLERRFSSGLGFLSSYTWAHSIDNVGNQFGGSDNGPFPQDPRYRNVDRGTSGFDITHRFVLSMNYSLPFGKGKRWSLANPFANGMLGGWDTNLIFTTQTGLPFTPTLANAVSNAGGSRPDRYKEGTISNKDPARWYDTSFGSMASGAAWGTPAQFTYGNSGRNILRGPGRRNIDFSLFKDFSPKEFLKAQFRAEVFNLFNTPQFDLPNSGIGNPAAGTITGIVGNPRQIQLGLRISF
ncbi:MAG: TonB-dependent receptor [Bryobacteraceae bacterium]|nr:TonB-dependent receptor [Bryobacteraceae bacterium]